MSDSDYRGFQMLTRLGNRNVRQRANRTGVGGVRRSASCPAANRTEMLRWRPQIVTAGMVENHARRGINVRTVFYANDSVATGMRRAAIAVGLVVGQPPGRVGTLQLSVQRRRRPQRLSRRSYTATEAIYQRI